MWKIYFSIFDTKWIFLPNLYSQREHRASETDKTAESIPERMSDDESTRYGFPEEDWNVDDMEQIMVNFVAGSTRNRYNNYNVLFIMCIFNKGEPLNKSKITMYIGLVGPWSPQAWQ